MSRSIFHHCDADTLSSKQTDSVYSICCVFVVPPTGQLKPECRYSYPESPSISVDQITPFCFPYHPKADVSLRRQEFIFTLTDGAGDLQYGFCLQEEPATPASNAYCFCIVSPLSWFSMFQSVLQTAARLYHKEATLVTELLGAFGSYDFPVDWDARGETVRLHVQDEALTFHCPNLQALPPLFEEPNVHALCTSLSHNNVLTLIASVLYERRIIVTSSNIGLATAVVHAVNRLVYPLTWQHIFIPIMPQQLLDYCSAPIPFVVGVHSSLIEAVKQMPLEPHVLIDVDEDSITTPFTDFDDVPAELFSPVKAALKKNSQSNDVVVLRTLLDMNLGLYGNYLDFFSLTAERTFKFDFEVFIQSKPKNWSPFIDAFASSQPFLQFIDQKAAELAENKYSEGIFERRLPGYLEMRRHIKDFKSKARKTFSKFKGAVVSKKPKGELEEMFIPPQSGSMPIFNAAAAPTRPRSEFVTAKERPVSMMNARPAPSRPRATQVQTASGANLRRLSRGAQQILLAERESQQGRRASLQPARAAPAPPDATTDSSPVAAEKPDFFPVAPPRASSPATLVPEPDTKARSKSYGDIHKSNPFWKPTDGSPTPPLRTFSRNKSAEARPSSDPQVVLRQAQSKSIPIPRRTSSIGRGAAGHNFLSSTPEEQNNTLGSPFT